MVYDLLKLARMQDIQDFTEKLNDRTNILTYNNAAAHNSIYRGKNLGTAITGDMIANIRNGSFKDWYPGDVFTLPIDGTTTTYVVGCNVNPRMWNINNMLLLLHNTNWNFPINDEHTCTGGLLNSKMYTVHLPYILGKIKEVIPEANIIGWQDMISDSLDSSGNVNHWTTVSPTYIGIPSFCNIIGYDVTENHGYLHAGRNPNWPAFRLSTELRQLMVYKWLDSNGKFEWDILHYTGTQRGILPPNKTIEGDFPILVCPYIHIG